jgi:hypothetical protein
MLAGPSAAGLLAFALDVCVQAAAAHSCHRGPADVCVAVLCAPFVLAVYMMAGILL